MSVSNRSRSRKSDDFAEGFASLLDNIKGSFDVRIKSLGETISDTHQVLCDFKKNREEMAEDLRKFLNKFKINLQNQDLERFEDFQEFFDKLSSENSEAAKELRNFLKKYNLHRLQDFFSLMKPIQNALHSMHNELKTFQNEMTHKRARLHGFHAGPVSSIMKTKPQKHEEIRAGKGFKVKSKGKKKKSR